MKKKINFYKVDGLGNCVQRGEVMTEETAFAQAEEGCEIIIGTMPADMKFERLPIDPTELLEVNRNKVISAIKAEAIDRIKSVVPAIDSPAMIDLMVELWPMLNTDQAGADILEAKRLAQKARQLIALAKGATIEQIEVFNPASENNWV